MTRIGIIDDDRLVRQTTGNLLRYRGLDVMEFDSAESLLQFGSAAELDCLVVDFHLAGMSGLDLLHELRDRCTDVPCIIMSGFTTSEEVVELTSAGAAAVMQKPIRSDQLLKTVSQVTSAAEAA